MSSGCVELKAGPRPRLAHEPDAATERVLADPDARETPCSPIHGIPGVSETVSIAAAGRTLALRGAPGALDPRCVSGNVADLEALFSAAHQVMSRHYPSPFE